MNPLSCHRVLLEMRGQTSVRPALLGRPRLSSVHSAISVAHAVSRPLSDQSFRRQSLYAHRTPDMATQLSPRAGYG